MKKFATAVMLIVSCIMLTACDKKEAKTTNKETFHQQYTISDPDATDLVAYFGFRTEGELEEIPTFDNFLLSQEKAHISTLGLFERNTYIYFKEPIESVVLETADDCTRKDQLFCEKVEDGLYRILAHSTYTTTLKSGDVAIVPYIYSTYIIKRENGTTCYMTWVAPKSNMD